MGFFKKVVSFFNPRYSLALDSHECNKKNCRFYYRFKIYGFHGFLKLTFHEIKESKNIIFSINPYDLLWIIDNETKQSESLRKFKITETLRNDTYKLSSIEDEFFISGNDLFNNLSLIEKMNSLDVYKIAYNTGFLHGRRFTKKIFQSKQKIKNYLPDIKIVNFKKKIKLT